LIKSTRILVALTRNVVDFKIQNSELWIVHFSPEFQLIQLNMFFVS